MNALLEGTTDRDLLNRFRKSKDREAFTEIVHRYGPAVFGICRRVLGDAHRAEDAFQQTFMNLARFGHKIQKPEALAGWLCAAALRSALAIAPRQRHQTASLNEGIASPERDPLDEISGRELIWVIEQELAVLPNEYRSAILLCGIEGLSIDEAAHRLGVTSGTLRGWLQRGRELLKKRMSYRGLALPAALGAVFGLPATVSAATTTSTINAALAVAAGKPAYLTMFHWASKFVWLGALFAAAFLAWMVYRSLPELERQASPLEITKWELSTDAPLPPGAIARVGDGRFTLQLGTKQIRFAEGRSKLVAVGRNELLAWDVGSGEQIHRTTIQDEPGDVSPDGKWFVQLGNIYNALTGKLEWKAFEDFKPQEVRFVGPKQVALIFQGKQEANVLIRQLDLEARSVAEATFAGQNTKPLPGGTQVAVWDIHGEADIRSDDERAGDIRIHLFAKPEAKPIVLSGFKGVPLTVETDAAGKRLFAVTSDGQLSCWNTSNGERMYQAEISLPVETTTNRKADGSEVKIQYISSTRKIQPLAVAPKGDKVVCRSWKDANPGDYICHSVDQQKLLWTVQHPFLASHSPSSFLFDEAHGRLIVNNQTIGVLDTESGERLSPRESNYVVRGPTELGKQISNTMALSADGRLLAFSNNTIGLYDMELLLDPRAEAPRTPETSWRDEYFRKVGFMHGSSRLVWVDNPKLSIYDTDECKKIASDDSKPEEIHSKQAEGPKWVSFDRWKLAWTERSWDGTQFHTVIRPASEELKNSGLDKHRPNKDQYVGLIEPHENCLYVGEIEGGEKPRAFVTRWDVMAGWKKRVYCIDPDKSYTPTARITSDGITEFPQYQPINLIPLKSGKLFVLTNGRAILLDLETGRGLKSVSAGTTNEKRVDFENAQISDDGSLLAVSCWIDGDWRYELRFLKADDLSPVANPIDLGKSDNHSESNDMTWRNHTLAISHDAKLIAVAPNSDKGVEVFDIASGKRKYHLPKVVYCPALDFSADGRRLVAMEPNHFTALVWNLSDFIEK